MGFWQRLFAGEPLEVHNPERLLPQLLASYQEEVRLAQQLRAHADQAPHQAGAQGLRAAAEEQERLVSWLRDEIVAQGGEGNDNAGSISIKEGKNHWARVVHDMQDNLALERRYNEQAIRYDPALPEVAALFRTLAREKGQISALLRDIASLADPHALD